MSEQGSDLKKNDGSEAFRLLSEEADAMIQYEESIRRKFLEGSPDIMPIERWVRRIMSPVERDVRKLNATPLTTFLIYSGRVTDYLLLTRSFNQLPSEFDLNPKK